MNTLTRSESLQFVAACLLFKTIYDERNLQYQLIESSGKGLDGDEVTRLQIELVKKVVCAAIYVLTIFMDKATLDNKLLQMTVLTGAAACLSHPIKEFFITKKPNQKGSPSRRERKRSRQSALNSHSQGGRDFRGVNRTKLYEGTTGGLSLKKALNGSDRESDDYI